MLQYIIHFNDGKVIRMGALIANSVGPFPTIFDAMYWYDNATKTWMIPPPECTILPCLTPDA